ncbi:hypothetical protein [Janthinobacterium sp. HH01]|uniref:hypothetical protein n=1 Tax=Janthinobacterium sp. HH01 TaxID=1198452 RepID=UPI0012692F43|nr:hypothetical protein [Janthinobacterium sp. HH01]
MKDIADISHDLAMAAMFLEDPDFAAYFLCDVLADGDEMDLALLLPQLESAFDAVWVRVPDLAGRLREFFSEGGGGAALTWCRQCVSRKPAAAFGIFFLLPLR